MKKMERKLLSLLLGLGLVLLILPIVSIAASIPADLTGQTGYLVVHNTTDAYAATGGPSSLTLKKEDGTPITPSNNTYSNIPDGATLNLTYVFHLEDGDEENLNEYSDSNYFTVTLPQGITFDYNIGQEYNINATDLNTGSWVMGTWTFTAANTIKVKFSAEVADHKEMWGKFTIEGSFKEMKPDDNTTTTLNLGSQTLTFVRELPPPPNLSLAKIGAYDAATNAITWTVTVTPPDSTTDIGGYSLVDAYSGNQTYKSSTFYVGTANIPDSSLNLATANKVIYTFPHETYGTQTISYKTTPNTFSGETGSVTAAESSTFTNTATVNQGSTAITDPVVATVTTNWISKSNPSVTTSGGVVYIKWTVVATVPNGGTITGATITDTLPAGLELVEGDSTHPIQITAGSTTTTVSPGSAGGTYAYTYTNATTSSSLIYQFDGSLTGTATFTYYTKVTNRQGSLNNNGTVAFTNSASLKWTGMPDATNPPKDIVTATVAASGGLLSKTGGNSAVYTYPGDINWTITVNNNAISMTSASVKDTVPSGQKLLIDADHAFVVKNSAGTVVFQTNAKTATSAFTSTDSFVNDFSYAFASITEKYTVSYYTEIIDVNTASNGDTAGLDTLYNTNNANVSFGNKAVLSRSGETDVTVTPNKTYQSQMIAKSIAQAYDYTTHIMQWKIVINRNKLPLTNAAVSDTLPAGMVLLIDASHPFVVWKNADTASPVATAPTTGANGTTSFTYNIGATSDQYSITFYSQITNEQLIYQWSGTKTFTNNAVLSATELKNNLPASATANIANPVVTKSASYTSGSDHIDYTAVINPAQIQLTNAYVTDKLDAGLELQASSVKLYRVEVNPATGVANTTGTLVTQGYTVTYPSTQNNNTLTVTLPDGKDTYLLKLTAYVLADDIDFTNTISLSGTGSTSLNTASGGRIVINNLWSSGGSGSQILTVHKEDGKGHAVQGAVYRLLNFNHQVIYKKGQPITATTDSSGDAVFKNLPAWLFYAEEVSVPDGYLLNTAYIGGQRLDTNLIFNTTDQIALGDLSFDKVATDGAILSGGTFTLTGTDYNQQTVTRTAAADNGVVTFKDLPVGTYTVTETEAPAGYVESDDTITVTVGYEDSTKAAVKVTITSENDTISNHPFPTGTIVLHKTDGVNGVADAEFTLYDEDHNVVATAVSLDDGAVTFSDVAAGTYTVKETKAPIGYLLNDTVLTVTITYNEDKTEAIVDVTPNTTVIDEAIAPATVELTKTNGENPLKDATFGLYDSNNVLLQTAVSDIDGLVKFTEVTVGTYTIKETAAPKDYLLSDKVVTAVVAYNEENTAMVVTLTPDEPFVNTIDPKTQVATVELMKTDDTGAALKGAIFGLYNESGAAVAQSTSDSDGKVTFANVLIGKYTIKEISAPAGYTLSNTVITVEVTKADVNKVVKTTPNTIVDKRIGATIQIKKIDGDTNKILSGAVFTLFDAKGNVVTTATSGKDGLAVFKDVMPGTYTISETQAPSGYTASTQKITVTAELAKTYTYDVKNTAKDTLPQSGIFWDGKMLLLAGVFLILVGGVIGLWGRKRWNDQES